MKKRRAIFSPVYLTLILLLMYLPILIVILYSFNDSKSSGMWVGFTTDWYTQLLRDSSMGQALVTSLELAAWSVFASGIIGTLGAVGMAKARFRGRGLLETASTLPIMIPEIILGMAYLAVFSAAFTLIESVIPAVDLGFGMFTLVIAHTTFCIPYVYINVKGRLAGMDPAMEEAARDLGASPLGVFFTVTLPLIAPAVASGMLLSLAMSLDDVVISFFVTGPTTNTLPLKIFSGLKTGVTPKINALCTLMLAAVFLIVALSQWASAFSRERQDHAASKLN